MSGNGVRFGGLEFPPPLLFAFTGFIKTIPLTALFQDLQAQALKAGPLGLSQAKDLQKKQKEVLVLVASTPHWRGQHGEPALLADVGAPRASVPLPVPRVVCIRLPRTLLIHGGARVAGPAERPSPSMPSFSPLRPPQHSATEAPPRGCEARWVGRQTPTTFSRVPRRPLSAH